MKRKVSMNLLTIEIETNSNGEKMKSIQIYLEKRQRCLTFSNFLDPKLLNS